jgi:hypothetical protein
MGKNESILWVYLLLCLFLVQVVVDRFLIIIWLNCSLDNTRFEPKLIRSLSFNEKKKE